MTNINELIEARGRLSLETHPENYERAADSVLSWLRGLPGSEKRDVTGHLLRLGALRVLYEIERTERREAASGNGDHPDDATPSSNVRRGHNPPRPTTSALANIYMGIYAQRWDVGDTKKPLGALRRPELRRLVGQARGQARGLRNKARWMEELINRMTGDDVTLAEAVPENVTQELYDEMIGS